MSKKGQKNKKAQAPPILENFQIKQDLANRLDKIFQEADKINKSEYGNVPQDFYGQGDIPALLRIFNITADIQESTRKSMNIFNQLKISNEQ